jgi:hypothetical protein
MSIAYVFTGYNPDFIPFLIGVWIEQLVEIANKAQTVS